MICGINLFCDETQNYCIAGQCLSKTTVNYAAIAGVFIFFMVLRESKAKETDV